MEAGEVRLIRSNSACMGTYLNKETHDGHTVHVIGDRLWKVNLMIHPARTFLGLQITDSQQEVEDL